VQHTLTLLRAEAILVAPAATVRGVAENEEDDLALAPATQAFWSPREFLTVLADEQI